MSTTEKKKDCGRLIRLSVYPELLILGFGIFLSLGTTMTAVGHSPKYAVFFGFTLLGILMIGVLIFLMIKKFKLSCLVGIAFIMVYLIGAGYGAIVCSMYSQRAKHLDYYKGRSVTAIVDETAYKWDGESVTYNGGAVRPLEGDHKHRVYLDETESTMLLYVGDDPSKVYVCIYSGASGEFLILDRSE